MAGNSFGKIFKIMTFGESHGRAVGVVVDGCPAGISIEEADIQEELANKLLFNRIKPYYVFQGDLVSGTSHLRVNLGDTIKIEKELRKRVSGLAMPNFVSDLPQGGGKVPLSDCYVKEHVGNKWILETLDGERREYPDTY